MNINFNSSLFNKCPKLKFGSRVVNEKTVSEFKDIYESIKQDMFELSKKGEEEYKNNLVSDSSENNIELPLTREKLVSTAVKNISDTKDEYAFARNMLAILPKNEKEKLSRTLLFFERERQKQIPAAAYEKTEIIYKLSKHNNGIDTSDIETKKQIAELIKYYESEFNEDNIIDELVKYCSDDNGKVDINLAYNVMDVLCNQSFKTSVEKTSTIVKTFCDKDPEHTKDIIQTIKALDKSNFIMCDNGTYFEDFLNLCFDKDGKFNNQRKNILFTLMNLTDEWTGKLTDININFYDRCNNYSALFIKQYFEDYDSGRQDGSSKSINEFISEKTKGLS